MLLAIFVFKHDSSWLSRPSSQNHLYFHREKVTSLQQQNITGLSESFAGDRNHRTRFSVFKKNQDKHDFDSFVPFREIYIF